ncbi:MAG: hypothetical protein KGK06_04685 [Xanthomonadaceae bacterium]|nr:hypothetical protein [Xanthomonadaceae bacterium]MDE2315683.1 hypothetical protein [Xanthomonadaceae bacterium]
MRSPLIGLLLQHGHVHSAELTRRLDREDQRPQGLRDALRRLVVTDVERRNAWRGAVDKARRLFPINSP